MTQNSIQPDGAQTLWQNLLNSCFSKLTMNNIDVAALILRIGIGSVFIIGGWWKLSRALDPSRADALVEKYLAPDGYINAFFQDYLFTNDIISPWMFLTTLSTFELLAGIALILGFFVRPLAIIFGLLMWSFVAALPVLTTPGLSIEGRTFLTPALIVQIRDIGLSGMCFSLVLIGSGKFSLDKSFMNRGAPSHALDWTKAGLLLRISLAVPFLAGGAFYGLDHVKSWSSYPLLLIIIGLILLSGHGVRVAACICFAVITIYCLHKFSIDKTLWDNLNAVKREIAFLATSIILIRHSGGHAFQIIQVFRQPLDVFFGKLRES